MDGEAYAHVLSLKPYRVSSPHSALGPGVPTHGDAPPILGRFVVVRLTDAGVARARVAFQAHNAVPQRAVEVLTRTERDILR